MATLELSPGFVAAGYITRLYSLGATVTAPSSNILSIAATEGLLACAPNQANSSDIWFSIMKGVVPVDFSTLTSYGARSADVLITYNSGGVSNPGDFSVSVPIAANPATVTSNYKNATASGTATWFWWMQRNSSPLNSTDPLVHQIIGSVGVSGSGADLEIPDVIVTAGNAYRIYNLRFLWPTVWTF